VFRWYYPVLTPVLLSGVYTNPLAFSTGHSATLPLACNFAWRGASLSLSSGHSPVPGLSLPVKAVGSERATVATLGTGFPSLGYRAPLLSGDAGVSQTVRLMRKLIDQAVSDPSFVRFAIDLVRDVPAHDEQSEVATLFHWVLTNIRFTKDPVTKEKLYPPQQLLQIRAGDCDDISMLIAALAIAIGYPARLVTVAATMQAPEDFSHVYVEVELPPGSDNWIALDAARPGAQFGLSPEFYTRKRAWSLTDSSYTDLGSYTHVPRLPGLGDDDDDGSGIDWTGITTQILQETPQLVAVATGQPSSLRTSSGLVSTTGSPYASYATPYTPGATTAAGGYSLQQMSSSLFSSALPWILIGAVVLALSRR